MHRGCLTSRAASVAIAGQLSWLPTVFQVLLYGLPLAMLFVFHGSFRWTFHGMLFVLCSEVAHNFLPSPGFSGICILLQCPFPSDSLSPLQDGACGPRAVHKLRCGGVRAYTLFSSMCECMQGGPSVRARQLAQTNTSAQAQGLDQGPKVASLVAIAPDGAPQKPESEATPSAPIPGMGG
jgi:hypothetical protein